MFLLPKNNEEISYIILSLWYKKTRRHDKLSSMPLKNFKLTVYKQLSMLINKYIESEIVSYLLKLAEVVPV